MYGTHNLRVVDLSILPLHINAPTQGTFCLPLSTLSHETVLILDRRRVLVYVYAMAEQGEGNIWQSVSPIKT